MFLNLGFFQFVFLFSIILSFCQKDISVSSQVLSSLEYDALWSLYNSTNGEHWLWRSSDYGEKWVFDGVTNNNPCPNNWQGITCDCDVVSCSVVDLSLPWYRLKGSIPNSLNSLSKLQKLILSENHLTGKIPASLGQLKNLQYFDLSGNFLNGTIPVSLGNLSNLLNLNLGGNDLRGTIPVSLGNLSNLQSLNLSLNHLTGSIPVSLGELSNLQLLYLHVNRLSDSIPSSLGNLSNLLYFNSSLNHFIGTIPASFGNMSKLQQLYMYVNHLSGTIPSTLGNLVDMQQLILNTNRLKGTIPASLGNLHNLLYLHLDTNFLRGTIPAWFRNLSKLQDLYLYNNRLSGTIPAWFGNLPKLRDINIYTNLFSGTIPASLGDLSNLQYFHLNSNHLTGSIPASLGNSSDLQHVYFYMNHLNGTIPSTLGNLSKLEDLYLYNNHLSGSIPESFGRLSNLQQLYLHTNRLSGPIPSSLGNLVKLQYLYLQHNSLSCTIPISLASLRNLASVRLQHNRLVGSLPIFAKTINLVEFRAQNNSLFGDMVILSPNLTVLDLSSNLFGNKSTQQVSLPDSLTYLNLSFNQLSGSVTRFLNPSLSALRSIDLSHNKLTGAVGDLFARYSHLTSLLLSNNTLEGNIAKLLNEDKQRTFQSVDISLNAFTGTIPDYWFRFPNISSIVLTSNCITGSLPNTACSTKNLVTLVLDGMGSSASCIVPLLGAWSNGIYILEGARADFDSCLLNSLPRLQTLHLSGINLKGSLESVQSLPRNIRYLSLSNNDLTGTVPEVFYRHENWVELDLSFNRLSGTLHPFVSSNATLALTQNRLSGSIPMSIISMFNVSILSGNLFSCDYERRSSELPQYDLESETYQCGSNQLNIILFMYLSTFCVSLSLVLWYSNYRVLFETALETLQWMSLKGSGSASSHFVIGQLAFMCSVVAMVCIFILLPMYCILKLFYGTYYDQYSYTISSGYISGIAPSVLLFIIYVALLGICVYLLRPKLSESDRDTKDTVQIKQHDSAANKDKTSLWIGFILISFISASTTTVCNVLYVYALVMNLGQTIDFGLVVTLASLKLFFNHLLLQASQMMLTETTTYITTALLCFNNVVVPYLGEAFVSGNCFLYATFRAVPTVSSVVSVNSCGILFNPELYIGDQFLPSTYLYCFPTSKSISYQPPFIYNYSCSASLLSNFAGVFILRFLTSGYIIPLILWTVSRLLQYYNRAAGIGSTSLFYKVLLMIEDKRWKVCRLLSHTSTESVDEYVRRLAIELVYDRRKFVPSLLSDILVMMSFGVMYPLLAVVIWISILVHVRNQQLVLHTVDEYVKECSQGVREDYYNRLNYEMTLTANLVRYSVPLMLCFTAAFWSLTLFDTLGDAVGALQASWIVVLMCVCPFFWYALFSYLDKYRKVDSTKDQTYVESTEVENPIRELSLVDLHGKK